jgi:hypothetical protein
MLQAPALQDGVPFAAEQRSLLPHVVPHVAVAFRFVSQSVVMPSQSPNPGSQPAIPHVPPLQEGVPFATRHATGVPQSPAAVQVCTPVPEHCSVVGLHAVHRPAKHAPMLQSPSTPQFFPTAQGLHDPPQSTSVSVPFFTKSVHCASMHLPVALSQRYGQGVDPAQIPDESQVCGVSVPGAQCFVAGTHSPVQAPAEHTYGHVSFVSAVTRSTPHSSRSLLRQKGVATGVPIHSVTIGLQNPTFPVLVSQLLPEGHVPLLAQRPPLHTS